MPFQECQHATPIEPRTFLRFLPTSLAPLTSTIFMFNSIMNCLLAFYASNLPDQTQSQPRRGRARARPKEISLQQALESDYSTYSYSLRTCATLISFQLYHLTLLSIPAEHLTTAGHEWILAKKRVQFNQTRKLSAGESVSGVWNTQPRRRL